MVSKISDLIVPSGKFFLSRGAISYGIASYIAFNPVSAPAACCALVMPIHVLIQHIFVNSSTITKALNTRFLFDHSVQAITPILTSATIALLYGLSAKQVLIALGICMIANFIITKVSVLISYLRNTPIEELCYESDLKENGYAGKAVNVLFSYGIARGLGFNPLAVLTFTCTSIGTVILADLLPNPKSRLSDRNCTLLSHVVDFLRSVGMFTVPILCHRLSVQQLMAIIPISSVAMCTSRVTVNLLFRCFQKKTGRVGSETV